MVFIGTFWLVVAIAPQQKRQTSLPLAGWHAPGIGALELGDDAPLEERASREQALNKQLP